VCTGYFQFDGSAYFSESFGYPCGGPARPSRFRVGFTARTIASEWARAAIKSPARGDLWETRSQVCVCGGKPDIGDPTCGGTDTLRPSRWHLVGVVVSAVVSIVLLRTLIPDLYDIFFSPTLRFSGVRSVSTYYLTIALIPVVFWLLPPFLRFLARSTYAIHKRFVGADGYYVRFPITRRLRFRDTLVLALGPFALDLLVISELTYLVSAQGAADLARGRVLIPSLFLLAGLLTAFVPGHWLLDALDVRLISPKRGEVTRASALFERFFGPVGAVALLAAFVTMLHSVNYSYEQGLVSLADWALRLFPPVIAAVAFYRVVMEPRILPSLERWCESEGILLMPSLDAVLESVRPRPPSSVVAGPANRPVTSSPRQP
jgi:hypothetical protein